MAVVFAMLLPVFIVVAALAIDMGYSYWKRNTVQVDASASALAGAGTLMDDGVYDPVNDIVIFATIDPDGDGIPNDPDSAVIWTQALYYAEENIRDEDILAAIDLHAGNWEPAPARVFTSAGTWDPDTLLFTPSPAQYDSTTGTWSVVADPVMPLNAVMATTRRADDGPNVNPLPLFLAAAVGLPEVNINTSAIATVGAQTPIGFEGCLMAMNETEEDTFLAFGTADISAYDCDIYVNSEDECALSGNGVPVVEVGDDTQSGQILIVGGSCPTNDGVVYNCNLVDEDGDGELDGACPEEGADGQIDPFGYMEFLKTATSPLATLQDLACGLQYDETTANYSNGYTLAQYYEISLEDSFDSTKHTGVGEFKVDAYVQWELSGGGACTPDGGAPDSGLSAINKDTGVPECVVPVVYPPDPYYAGTDPNPLVGQPIISGTKVEVDDLGWNWAWDESGDGTGRQEFTMVPGAYCGGINVRGDGTIVFEDGDYVLKGQAVAGETGGKDEFNLRANTAIEGFNVAFYLADEYIEINWGGTADVALIGRQYDNDPMNSFLFYADPTNEGPHQFRGTPAGGYQGIMYFPEGDVVFKGTADSGLAQIDGEGICTILIADTIYFNGTTAFNASADGCGDGGFEIPPVGAELEVGLVD
jgi:hypothetical protein